MPAVWGSIFPLGQRPRPSPLSKNPRPTDPRHTAEDLTGRYLTGENLTGEDLTGDLTGSIAVKGRFPALVVD